MPLLFQNHQLSFQRPLIGYLPRFLNQKEFFLSVYIAGPAQSSTSERQPQWIEANDHVDSTRMFYLHAFQSKLCNQE